jgi:hypothetical protein
LYASLDTMNGNAIPIAITAGSTHLRRPGKPAVRAPGPRRVRVRAGRPVVGPDPVIT